jgi:cell division protein FtsW
VTVIELLRRRVGEPGGAEQPDHSEAATANEPGAAEEPGDPPARSGPAPYRWLLAVIVLLHLFGLVMVFSASSVQAIRDSGAGWYYFNRQLLFSFVGFCLLLVVCRVDYHWWRRRATALYLGALFLLALVLAVGAEVNGSRQWLPLGPFNVQPSELAKLALLLFVAAVLASRSDVMGDKRRTLHTSLLAMAPAALLVMLEPDLGSAIIFTVIVIATVFIAGVPLRPLAGIALVAVSMATLLAIVAPYRRARLLGFADPWSDVRGVGYHTIQSMVGLATGGFTGTGLGESRAKWGFLPHAHSDFIFAIIGEELGLLGALLVLGLVCALAVLGFQAALRAPDLFGTIVAGGITAWFLAQAFINIGGVVGVMPITGVTLPFVSFGGSSLLVSMVAAGILLNIARQGRAITVADGGDVGGAPDVAEAPPPA